MTSPEKQNCSKNGHSPNPLEGAAIHGDSFRRTHSAASRPTPEELAKQEQSKIKVLNAITSGTQQQLNYYIERGIDLTWSDGGALQYALTQAKPEAARRILQTGVPTEGVCLGLLAREPILDAALIKELLEKNVKVKWINNESPALETLCSYAFDKEYRQGLTEEQRQNITNIIDMLAESKPENPSLLSTTEYFRARFSAKHAQSEELSEREQRCAWLVNLLLKHKLGVDPWICQRFSSVNPSTLVPSVASSTSLSNPEVIYQRLTQGQAESRELASIITSQKNSSPPEWTQRQDEELLDLFLRSRRQDHLPVLELLKRTQPTLSQEARNFALCQLASWADVNTLNLMLELKADIQSYNNTPLVFAYHRHQGNDPSNLGVVKHLVERGANPIEAMETLPTFRSLDRVPLSWTYLWLMTNVLDHTSDDHKNLFTIETPIIPRDALVGPSRGGFKRGEFQVGKLFKLLSSCAATAAVFSSSGDGDLVDSRKANSLFFKLIRQEMEILSKPSALLEDRSKRMNTALADYREHMQEFALGFTDSIVLPALVQNTDAASNTLDKLEIKKIVRLRQHIAAHVPAWLAETLTFHQIGSIIEKWKKQQDRLPLPKYCEGSWHSLIEDTELFDGVIVTAITSSEGLIQEGYTMKNCLKRGLHTPSCMVGQAHILAIRKNGKSVLNLTVKERPEFAASGGERWYISHYEGESNNTTPNAELMNYVETFRSRLASGEIPSRQQNFGQTKESLDKQAGGFSLAIERTLSAPLKSPAERAQAFYKEKMGIPEELVFTSEAIPHTFMQFKDQLTGDASFGTTKRQSPLMRQ